VGPTLTDTRAWVGEEREHTFSHVGSRECGMSTANMSPNTNVALVCMHTAWDAHLMEMVGNRQAREAHIDRCESVGGEGEITHFFTRGQ
jgi:hypothetical protein